MDPKKDYYAALELTETATAEEIRKSFRRLARKYHPDVNPNDKKAEEKFKEISEANDVVGDEAKRRTYDQIRSTGASAPSWGPEMDFERLFGDKAGAMREIFGMFEQALTQQRRANAAAAAQKAAPDKKGDTPKP